MNIITIAGRIGKDAELRYTPDGKPVTSFSLADDNFGKTTWWRCSMFGDKATKLNEYLNKGKAVTVSGRVTADDSGSPRIWTKDGNAKASFEMIVNDIALQGGKQDQPAEQGEELSF